MAWVEEGIQRSARWLSESRPAPPARLIPVDDTMTADRAYSLACQGTAMLWRGDFHNARQLLAAMARRADRKRRAGGRHGEESLAPPAAFHRYRMDAARRAHVLGMLLVELEPDYSMRLGRAPDVGAALEAAHGPADTSSLIPLHELLGIIGAHEWRKKGVEVPALGGRIHPHYGVFSPIRQEYIELVATTPLPSRDLAFDIGTGTGVLAAVLARRGVARVIGTDNEPRAVACARENVLSLGLADQVEVVESDLFPPEGHPQRAPLIVCNPPWIPAKAATSLERAVYDPKGRMLGRFLAGLPDHLTPSGEAWLVLSDLAERLGLRTREELLSTFDAAGLQVMEKLDARPAHRRATDESDPLHPFRQQETTSLWRLGV